MTMKSLFAPVALITLSGLLSACSSVTESLETQDVFAPGVEVAVPAPIAGQQIDFQQLQAPPAIQQIVQAPAPIFQPPVVQEQVFQQGFQQQGFQQQEFVEAPELPQVPVQQQVVEQVVEAPQQVITQYVQRPAQVVETVTVEFDCSIIPSSKSKLSEYRANCI